MLFLKLSCTLIKFNGTITYCLKKKTNTMFYEDIVYRHFENPLNVGLIKNPTHEILLGNPNIGAVIKVTAKVENETIKEISFKAYGGGALIACMSILTEKIKNKTITQALEITGNNLSEELNLQPVKLIYAIMAVDSIKNLLTVGLSI